MGRKRRLDKPQHVAPREDTHATPTSFDSCDESGDDTIPLKVILDQHGGRDKEYLRLRNVAGHLPLSFYAHFQDLRILNLRNCDIKALDAQITQLTQLRHVDVSGNKQIRLPSQLSRCNLTRLVHSPSLMQQSENDKVPYSPILNKQYCGDKVVHSPPRLARLAAQVIIHACCDLEELEEVKGMVPVHLRTYLNPAICAECGSVGRRIVATRVRNAVVAFHTVPLHYDLCSPTCLARIQEVWKLEELLNNEKRALRLQKFGRLEDPVPSYSYA